MRDVFYLLFGTLALAWLSRGALPRPASHGFLRFFAWECLLVLGLYSKARWGTETLAVQTVSLLLLAGSVLLPVYAAFLLQAYGQPAETARDDAALIGFEKTSRLVTDGVYRLIRHPMYTALLLLAAGLLLQRPDAWALGLAAASVALSVATALREEAECLAHFGATYRDYMQRTRRFVPFVV